MKLRNVQVCLGCEECFVGDYCTKCGDHHYFYIRAYFEPLFKFGGSHETVSIRNHGVSEKLPDIQTDLRNNDSHDHARPVNRDVAVVSSQATHPATISQRSIDEAGHVAKFGGFDHTGRIIMAAVGKIREIRNRAHANPPPDVASSVDEPRAS